MDFIKIAPIIFSTIAILISIATIFFTRQNLKRQLRLSKLEEILEILHFLDAYYRGLFILFVDTTQKTKLIEKKQTIPEYLNELSNNKNKFIESFDIKNLINKVSRLNVLSKAYLPKTNNLKSKVLTISDIYYAIYTCVYNDGYMRGKEQYSIIPKPIEMKVLVAELEEQIILEMKLGYKNLSSNELYKYYKNQFKKDLKRAITEEKKKLEK